VKLGDPLYGYAMPSPLSVDLREHHVPQPRPAAIARSLLGDPLSRLLKKSKSVSEDRDDILLVGAVSIRPHQM
jgi:hypothetical protein